MHLPIDWVHALCNSARIGGQ